MTIPIDAVLFRLSMSGVLFLLGVFSLVSGLRLILSDEYRDGMKELMAQSTRVSKRGVTEQSVAPIIDATSRLIDSVTGLVRTAFGMGAFLCLVGIALCTFAVWIIWVTLP